MPSKASEAYGARTALACGPGTCGCTFVRVDMRLRLSKQSQHNRTSGFGQYVHQSHRSSQSINSVNQATNLICFFRVVFSRAPPPNTKLEFVPKGLLVFVCDRFGLRTLNFVLGAVGRENTTRKKQIKLVAGLTEFINPLDRGDQSDIFSKTRCAITLRIV